MRLAQTEPRLTGNRKIKEKTVQLKFSSKGIKENFRENNPLSKELYNILKSYQIQRRKK